MSTHSPDVTNNSPSPATLVSGSPGAGESRDDPYKRLLWLDFETNGLHEHGYRVHVLEVAAVVTDSGLNELAVFEPVVLRAPDEAYAAMDDFVLNMHTENGLLDQ